jgi:hypothetical protein
LQEKLRQRGIKDVGLERNDAVEKILAADGDNTTRCLAAAKLAVPMGLHLRRTSMLNMLHFFVVHARGVDSQFCHGTAL